MQYTCLPPGIIFLYVLFKKVVAICRKKCFNITPTDRIEMEELKKEFKIFVDDYMKQYGKNQNVTLSGRNDGKM